MDLGLNDQINVKKFLAKRFDLLVMLDWAAAYNARTEGLDPEEFQPVLVLDDASSYWYGVSLGTSPEVVKKLNAACRRSRTTAATSSCGRSTCPRRPSSWCQLRR